MRDTLRWPRLDFLSHRVASTPDRPALIEAETDTEWTVQQLDSRVDAAVTRLRELTPAGTTPRVGLLLSPRPTFVVTLYAAWRLGWTVVGLNTTLSPPELEHRAERARLGAVVCEPEVTVPDSLDCPVLSADEVTGSETPGDTDAGEAIEPATWGPTETALVLFTSGTTGEPKGVRLTPGNLASSAMASAFRLGVSPTDRWLGCLPVYHMGGLAPAVRTVLSGTTLVVQDGFEVTETAAALSAYDITGVSLVPTQLTRLLDDGWEPPSSLRTVLLGGAPAPSSLLSRAREAGVPVHPTYGLTETTSQVTTARPTETREHPGTVGQPLVCTDVTIVENGQAVEPGERGEIVVDGPTVTPGYLDAERTAEAFSARGLQTGDVGYRDQNSRLWVVGRRDDVIITGGELVAPDEVREAMLTHPAIEDVAVVGLADEEWGERVAALVVTSERGEQLTRDAIRAHCRERLADFKLPKTVQYTDKIPRTASGTIDREAVRGAFERDA